MRHKFLTVIYISQSTAPQNDDTIPRLESEWRAQCEEREVSGALITLGDCYVWIIEGRPADVHCVVLLIKADRRERRLRLIHRSESDERAFAEWTNAHLKSEPLASIDLSHLRTLREEVALVAGEEDVSADSMGDLVRRIPALLVKASAEQTRPQL